VDLPLANTLQPFIFNPVVKSMSLSKLNTKTLIFYKTDSFKFYFVLPVSPTISFLSFSPSLSLIKYFFTVYFSTL
jgi:hypothetical protein